jgi:acyl carrier protein phosphodiesterase
MVGNFIADTVRGKDFSAYTPAVQLGIEIHRFIDHFTDTHLLPLESRKLLYPYFSKYAQVVQDIYYDHFLARNWAIYHHLPLPTFAAKVYHVMESNKEHLNERSLRTLHYMKLHNWLESYSSAEGIDLALKGMSRRAQFKSNMEDALPALHRHYDELSGHFTAFFPELSEAVSAAFGQRLK